MNFCHALAGQVPVGNHAPVGQALACHALPVQAPVDQGLPGPPEHHAYADQAPLDHVPVGQAPASYSPLRSSNPDHAPSG